jgi:hypothetical protein
MVRHTGEDLIDVEGVAVTTMISLQSPGVNSTEFDAPKTDRLQRDDDATFSQKIFDIAVT